MSKFLRMALFTALALMLVAGTAMAADSTITTNPGIIGWEATYANGYTTCGSLSSGCTDDGVTVTYNPAVPIAAGTSLTFTMAGATWDDSLLVLCGTKDDGTVGVVASEINRTNGGRSVTFQVGTVGTTSDTIYMGASSATPCNTTAPAGATNPDLQIAVRPLLNVGSSVNVAVTDALSNQGLTVDTALTSPATLLTSEKQFAVTFLPFNYVDPTVQAPATALITLDSNLTLFSFPNPSYPSTTSTSTVNSVLRACNLNGTTVASLGTNNWLPSAVVPDSNGTTGLVTISGVPSAIDAITYDGTTCSATGADPTTWVCSALNTGLDSVLALSDNCNDHLTTITADTTTPIDAASLSTRLIANFENADYTNQTYTGTSFVLTREGTTYYVPLIKTADDTETYIKLQTKSSIGTVGVSAEVLCNDGVMHTATMSSITAGTPLTISGTQLEAICTADGQTVNQSNSGFAAIIQVNATNTDVFAYANTCSSLQGCKRIPVETLYTINPLIDPPGGIITPASPVVE